MNLGTEQYNIVTLKLYVAYEYMNKNILTKNFELEVGTFKTLDDKTIKLYFRFWATDFVLEILQITPITPLL